MTSLYVDLVFDQGLKKSVEITLTDEYGTPVNLTGATITAQVRKTPSAPLLLDFKSRVTITDATAGEITIVMLASDTADLSAGLYQWDGIITWTNGDQMKIGGSFLILGTITEA